MYSGAKENAMQGGLIVLTLLLLCIPWPMLDIIPSHGKFSYTFMVYLLMIAMFVIGTLVGSLGFVH